VSSHEVTVAGYAVVAAAWLALELLSRRSLRIPPFGVALTRAMRTRAGRVGIVAGWAWFAMHLFVR
jgi:Family of unknown function (DUF6186)